MLDAHIQYLFETCRLDQHFVKGRVNCGQFWEVYGALPPSVCDDTAASNTARPGVSCKSPIQGNVFSCPRSSRQLCASHSLILTLTQGISQASSAGVKIVIEPTISSQRRTCGGSVPGSLRFTRQSRYVSGRYVCGSFIPCQWRKIWDEKIRRPRRTASSTEVESKLFIRSRRYMTEAIAFSKVSLGSWLLYSVAEFIVEQNLFRNAHAWTKSASIPSWSIFH